MPGTFRIFRVAGIEVSLHWAWLVVALFEIQSRKGSYSSPLWNALEYGALFVIVTLHEFGHALACRSVGGVADRIVLWPLGGVAFVRPPQRPGAVLWSIAAGPLVNVVLVPALFGLLFWARTQGLRTSSPDLYGLLRATNFVNLGLLIFNLLPIYPLDGGQILRALLWWPLGRANSLMAASVLGILGLAGLAALGVLSGSLWTWLIVLYAAGRCVAGFKEARALREIAAAPRREGFACPACRAAPPALALWQCERCGTGFDTFEAGAACPRCGTTFEVTSCPDCGERRPIGDWAPAPPATA